MAKVLGKKKSEFARVSVSWALAVLLQRVSLCYHTVPSQDYIPAEQRAGAYLLFISLCLYHSVSRSLSASLSVFPLILLTVF